MKFANVSSNLQRTMTVITVCFVLVAIGVGGVAAVSQMSSASFRRLVRASTMAR